MVTLKGSMSTQGETLQVLSYLTGARYVHPWWPIEHMTNISRTYSTVLADGPGQPIHFAAHRQPLCWNFMDHSSIVLSVGGSVWYMVRNLCCIVTINSVLANSKTHNASLFPVHAMFCHHCPLVVKPASTPQHLIHLFSILSDDRSKASSKTVLHIVRSRASSFKRVYSLLS
jgi:hypothetical protein